ncbi:MAG: T9SS C-terminal target domain-containing protein, partial [Flavobacteriia bacterium]|nr:T9SS C-terminal target domain-containing protein [Flavobacteriia bacterium]
GNFASIWLREGTNTGNLEIDEIRAGATWYQVTPCNTPTMYYADVDGDTYGNPNAPVNSCLPLPGLVLNNLDCDDNNAAVNPNLVWYADADGDGFGNLTMTTTGCTQPNGYVANSTDCNDNDSTANALTTYYQDADMDGFGNVGAPLSNCGLPVGYVTDSTDCDDANNQIYPGAIEICDDLDNNCDGNTDEGLPTYTLYEDMDGDGFGSQVSATYCDSIVAGWSLISGDCIDTNDQVYPGATEVLDNGIDENCDGFDNYAGLTDVSVLSIALTPNPSEGDITITVSNNEQFDLTICDVTGKLVLSSKSIVNGKTLSTRSWAPGTYFVTLRQNQQQIISKLMVK